MKGEAYKRLRAKYAYTTPARVSDEMRDPCAECGKLGHWDCDSDCCAACRHLLEGADNAEGEDK